MTTNEPDPNTSPQKAGQTETPESQTGLKPSRPNRNTLEPARWTIRGIETDTRLTIKKAGERSG